MSGKMHTDPLFIGLTRPSMIFGVSAEFAMLNIMICITIFIQTSSLWVIPILVIIHIIGYILCFKEPKIMQLYMTYSAKCNQCSNKSYYGANSYSV